MADTLRTRIAEAISGVDDWRGVTDPEIFADAVVAVLTESATECWDLWPARRCVILGNVDE